LSPWYRLLHLQENLQQILAPPGREPRHSAAISILLGFAPPHLQQNPPLLAAASALLRTRAPSNKTDRATRLWRF